MRHDLKILALIRLFYMETSNIQFSKVQIAYIKLMGKLHRKLLGKVESNPSCRI